MDARTGEIVDREMLKALGESVERFSQPINPANLTPKVRRQLETTGRTQVSRNSPCPCGSRKRFKRCCMVDPKEAR